jgi:tRNA U34 5-methylaminomethyl-2-thiouridine-forming methyltransferase MnmC
MKREVQITADGSSTIYLPDWNENYHSTHGAIQEAKHVFLKHGLEVISKSEIAILEIGFGTGLNCFLTLLAAAEQAVSIKYLGVEAYPVTQEEVQQLNYISELNAKQYQVVFDQLHAVSWGEKHQITKELLLEKRQQFFHEIADQNTFDLVYFDAFGAAHQPELWTAAIFSKMFAAMKENGVLVTYCAKGSVRRALQEVGFTVERLPGPPGKREMLRATKLAEQPK